MSNVPGDTIVLEALFYEAGGTIPVDVSDISLTILAPNGMTTILGPITTGIQAMGIGHFRYSWASSVSLSVGVYTVVWSGTDPNGAGILASEAVTMSTVASNWATADDVFSLTGATVTDDTLTKAQGVIDMFSGCPYTTSSRVNSRDRHWLKLAMSYQAAWIPRQPDLFGRMDFSGLTQDGNTITLRENAALLAPMARQALKKVSWLKSRSLHVRSAFVDGATPLSANPSAEANDAFHNWTPMGR